MSDSGQFPKDFRRKIGRALSELDDAQVQHDARIAALEAIVGSVRTLLWAALTAGASGVGLWVFTKLTSG